MRSRMEGCSGSSSSSSGSTHSTWSLSSLVRGAPAEELGPKGEGELLSDFAVVVCHDVTRVGVGAGDSDDFDVVTGLFLDLSDDRLGDGLTDLMAAAGKRPLVVVRLVDHQQASLVVLHDGHD